MPEMMGDREAAIRRLGGSHVLVCAGDGKGRIAEILFDSSNGHESNQIRDLLLQLLEARKGGNSSDNQGHAHG